MADDEDLPRAREGVGEAKSICKVAERGGRNGDRDTETRRMTTLLELECFFIFLTMEYVLDILLELL